MAGLAADTWLGDAPLDALNKAFTREARIGALILIGLSFYDSIFALLRWLWNYAPAIGKVHFFDWLVAYETAEAWIGVIGLVICIAAVLSKRPMAWLILSLAISAVWALQSDYLLFWHPAGTPDLPMFFGVRYNNLASYFVAIVAISLPLSKRLLMVMAAYTIAAQGLCTIWVFHIWPEARLYWGPFGPHADLTAIQNLDTLVPDYMIMQGLLYAAMAWFVIAITQQGRRFVVIRCETETALAYLSRFFPPAVADRIRRSGEIEPARRQAVVAFVDWGDELDLDALQQRYVAVEKLAFAHDGTIDRFSGGPLMLSFGAVEADGEAPRKGLQCALAITEGSKLRCALHYGDTLSGEFGGARTRSYSVVGDVVNTARRVLDVAREAGARIVATDEALKALPPDERPSAFTELPPRLVRGRETPIHLWGLA